MKTLFVFLFLLFSSSAWSELVIIKLNSEILIAPKNTPRTNNIILNPYSIRNKLDPTNNITFSDLGVQVDTLNKDLPWRLVYVNPYTKQTIDASHKMNIDVLASSQVGTLATITPQIEGRVFLLGDITEYRVIKLNLDLGVEKCEIYGAFNIRYRVIRNSTGDHWYPSSSFSFRGPGIFDNTTCVGTFSFIPPKIVIPTFYWTNVNKSLILSKP
jgi:hypothetical protein